MRLQGRRGSGEYDGQVLPRDCCSNLRRHGGQLEALARTGLCPPWCGFASAAVDGSIGKLNFECLLDYG